MPGLERAITEHGFVYSLSAVSKLHFHDSFLAVLCAVDAAWDENAHG